MSSTNKTTNYQLSQYVGDDKPTYLGDYNGDMLKIDTQMKTNNNLASTASTAAQNAATNAQNALNTANGVSTKIGDLNNLVTTEKTSVVGAINEVKNTSVLLEGEVGTLSNLTTENKTDLVGAINELDKNGLYEYSQVTSTEAVYNSTATAGMFEITRVTVPETGLYLVIGSCYSTITSSMSITTWIDVTNSANSVIGVSHYSRTSMYNNGGCTHTTLINITNSSDRNILLKSYLGANDQYGIYGDIKAIRIH